MVTTCELLGRTVPDMGSGLSTELQSGFLLIA